MEQLKRNDKIYLDKDCKIESHVNEYLATRDGVIKCYEYNDESGYGTKTRLFYCRDYKHEAVCIVRQVYIDPKNGWREETMDFDSDSFQFLEGLLNGVENIIGGKYTLVIDFTS